jgi:hypothetical protein
VLRPGNAGSNTAVDHIEVMRLALAQLPAAARRRVLARADSGGGTHEFLAWLGRRRLQYSVGIGASAVPGIEDAVRAVPARAWTVAHAASARPDRSRGLARPGGPAEGCPEAATEWHAFQQVNGPSLWRAPNRARRRFIRAEPVPEPACDRSPVPAAVLYCCTRRSTRSN